MAKLQKVADKIHKAITRKDAMNYQERFLQRNQHRIYVRDYAGEDPVIILTHGFPDNLHLYDRLSPIYLRRAI